MAIASRTVKKIPRNSKTPPEAALQDLMRSILNRRNGKPSTFYEMCDAVNRGPSVVRDLPHSAPQASVSALPGCDLSPVDSGPNWRVGLFRIGTAPLWLYR